MASKSLGTLTLDLIAKVGGFEAGMDKAARKAKSTSASITKSAKIMGAAVVAGAAAAAAGISVMVRAQLEAIGAQVELAQKLRTTYDSLTTLGRAGELAGVSMKQIEVASRSLDINLGKASQGIGAQADALAKLKLNADDLAKLPLDERINKINTALKENVSVTERAAIAADLFGARGASAIQQLSPEVIAEAARQVKIFGLNLSEVDAAKVEMAGDALSNFGLLGQGIAKQLTVELAPILKAVGDEFLNAAEEAGGLGDVVQEVTRDSVKGIAFLVDAVDGVGVAFRSAARSVGLAGAIVVENLAKAAAVAVQIAKYTPQGAVFNFATGGLDSAKQDLTEIARLSKVIGDDFVSLVTKDIQTPLAGTQFLAFYDKAQKAGEAAAAAAVTATEETKTYHESLKGTAETLEEIKVNREKYESAWLKQWVEDQEAYADLVAELRTDEEKLNDQLRERLAILAKATGATKEQRDETASRIAASAFQDAPTFAGLAPEVGGAFGELGKIDAARAELEEWYSDQLGMLEKYRSEQAELNAQWDEQEIALKQEHEDRLAEIESARQLASLAATEDLFGNLADISREFAGEQSGIFKTLFLIQKAAAIAQSLVAIQTGIAMAAANPFPANLAAMASVAAATASIVGNIMAVSLSGQAHDGIDSVPQSGTWNLKKGERVVTSETSAKLDKTLEDVRSSMQGGSSAMSQNLRIVNAFDTQVIGDYMGSDAGEKVIMNAVRRNQRTIRSLAV